MTQRIFVFCNNLGSYNHWLKKNNLNPFDYKFLDDEHYLYGRLGMDIVILGGFETHPRYDKIYELIKGLNFLGRIDKLDYYEDW